MKGRNCKTAIDLAPLRFDIVPAKLIRKEAADGENIWALHISVMTLVTVKEKLHLCLFGSHLQGVTSAGPAPSIMPSWDYLSLQ
jgi:hypothetical protein